VHVYIRYVVIVGVRRSLSYNPGNQGGEQGKQSTRGIRHVKLIHIDKVAVYSEQRGTINDREFHGRGGIEAGEE